MVGKQEHNLFISNDTCITDLTDWGISHTSQSRGCRTGFTRPPPSTLVTWAKVPFRRPENPSWRPCRHRRRTRTRRRRRHHRYSSCRVGLSIGPYPSESQDHRSHPQFSAVPSIVLLFRRSAGRNTLTPRTICTWLMRSIIPVYCLPVYLLWLYVLYSRPWPGWPWPPGIPTRATYRRKRRTTLPVS